MQNTTYLALFFDIALPAIPKNQNYKRITYHEYLNLVDETIPDKTIELVANNVTSQYSIINRRIFHLKNSVDNTLFLICDVEMKK